MSDSAFNPNFQINHLDGKIIVALERIAEAFRVGLWNESKEIGLSPIQIQILLFLNFHSTNYCKVSYLAKEFNMTKATISDAVKALEKKKLLTRIASEEDKRSHELHLTEKGKHLALKAANFTDILSKPLEKLSPEHKEQIWNGLFQLIHLLQANGLITVQRMCTNCQYFEAAQKGKPAYCKFLKEPLAETALRVDCPEHQAL